MSWQILAATLALILGGCAHRPSMLPMPIGIFDPPAAAYDELAEAGFNLIVTPVGQGTLDNAQKSRLKVLMTGGPRIIEKGDLGTFRRLDDHPATFGWYLQDEPDLHDVSPKRIRREHRMLRRIAKRPTVLVLASGHSVEGYAGISDLLAVDWYPVPWTAVGTVAREMRLARLSADGQPFMAIIQAFDWNSAKSLLETDVPLRAPTPAEVRCMSYLALMQGAAGIIYFAYVAAEWNIEQQPELRSALLSLAAELRSNEAIFRERVTWWPAQTDYHGSPDAMYNEIGEARVSLALFRGKKGQFHLVAANSTSTPVDFSFKLPLLGVQQVQTFCGNNQFEVSDGWIRKTYEPFEVCIFSPIGGDFVDE